jgi:hypothetical protein
MSVVTGACWNTWIATSTLLGLGNKKLEANEEGNVTDTLYAESRVRKAIASSLSKTRCVEIAAPAVTTMDDSPAPKGFVMLFSTWNITVSMSWETRFVSSY